MFHPYPFAPRDRDERGAGMTLAAAALTPALLLCVGLVVDGGHKAEATRQAISIAGAAARSGTDAQAAAAIAGTSDTSVAYQAAAQYLAQSGVQGSVTVNGETLTVSVTKSAPTVFLSMIGVDSLTAHGQATARLEEAAA